MSANRNYVLKQKYERIFRMSKHEWLTYVDPEDPGFIERQERIALKHLQGDYTLDPYRIIGGVNVYRGDLGGIYVYDHIKKKKVYGRDRDRYIERQCKG